MKKYIILILLIASITQAQGINTGFNFVGISRTAVSTTVTYDTGADSLFSALALRNSTPTDARKLIISNTIKMLKDSLGVVSLKLYFDRLWFWANYDTASAKTDWANLDTALQIKFVYNAIANTCFYADGGYTAWSWLSAYLKTNLYLTNGVNYTLNNGSVGFYIKTESDKAVTDYDCQGGGRYTYGFGRYGNVFYGDINDDGNNVTATNISSKGLLIVSRVNSDSIYLYKNSNLIKRGKRVATGIPSGILTYGSYSLSTYTDRLYSVGFVAKHISPDDARKINNCIQYYLNAISQDVYICDGNSITYGTGSTNGLTYPNQLGTLLGKNIYNVGIGSRTTALLLAEQQSKIFSNYDTTKKNVLMFFEGANDLATGITADSLYARTKRYCLNATNRGFKVCVLTIPAFNPTGYDTARLRVNDSIRTNYLQFAYGLADIGADSILGNKNNTGNTTYFSDGVHLTNTGYSRIAQLVYAIIKEW